MYCNAHPQNLPVPTHAFPTRRSSDLARGAGKRIEFSTVNISGHPMSAEGCRHLVDGHIRLSGVVLPVMRGTRGIKPFEPVSDARHTFFPGGAGSAVPPRISTASMVTSPNSGMSTSDVTTHLTLDSYSPLPLKRERH